MSSPVPLLWPPAEDAVEVAERLIAAEAELLERERWTAALEEALRLPEQPDHVPDRAAAVAAVGLHDAALPTTPHADRTGRDDGGAGLWRGPAASAPDAAAWNAFVAGSAGSATGPAEALAARGHEEFWAAPGVPRHWSTTAPRQVSATTDAGSAVAALLADLDALAEQNPSALPGPVALARTRLLLQCRERLTALSLEALTDVETRSLHTLDEVPSTAAWVDGLAVPGVDRAELALSRRLKRVPQIRAELTAGRLSIATAAALTRAVLKARPFLDRPDGQIDGLDGEQVLGGVLVDGISTLLAEQIGGSPDAEARLSSLRQELADLADSGATQQARWEAALIVLARESDPSLLPSGVALLLDALLPGEHAKRDEQAHDDRGLDLHTDTFTSGGRLTADLDAETRELLATVLDAAMRTDPAAPADTAAHGAGRQTLGEDLPVADWPAQQPRPRSKRQQRHDAFHRALRALLDSGALGLRGKTAPHVVVTTSLDFAEAVPGALPARAEHGTRLSRPQLRRLLCTSTFTHLVLSATNRVLRASHTQRTSTALERLLLKVQGGSTCSTAGCARGPATGHRLIPHHASLFHKTGTTELDDTILICEMEHDHHLHKHGQPLRLKDGRVLGPDGWVRR